MWNGAGIHEEIKNGIWAECAYTATFYSNILAKRFTKRSTKELLFGREAHCAHNLRMFGEIGIVTTKKKIQGKLKDRGTVCIFVRYSPNNSCDSYRIHNLKTKQIIKARGIVWQNKFFKDWIKKVEEINNKFYD
jgi:hypothetical protein